MADNRRRKPTAEEFARLELWERRRAAIEASPFNGDILRAKALVEQLMCVLDRLADYGPEVILDAWAEAGLPEYDPNDPNQALAVDAAEYVPAEAAGFAWACNMFLGTLQTEAIESRKAVRRGAARA